MGKKGKKGAQGDTTKNAADKEEDIDQLLHELDAKEGKRGLCHEEASERPSPRVHATLTQVSFSSPVFLKVDNLVTLCHEGRAWDFHALWRRVLRRQEDSSVS